MEADSRTANGPVGRPGDRADDLVNDPSTSTDRTLRKIASEGHLYNFFLLAELLSGITESRATGKDRIRFRASKETVFPATDVKRVEWNGTDKDPIVVVSTFMGLYGFHSPLPDYFSRSIELSRSTTPLQSFLDIFDNRFYRFFYQAWRKYRPARLIHTADADESLKYFLSIAGLSTNASDSPETLRLAAFAGQLGSVARNADGLKNLLTGIFRGFRVQIQENIPRWVWLSDRAVIGKTGSETGAILGQTATIGEKIRDISGKFRIILGPLDLDQFESCLPGAKRAKRIQSLVDRFVTDFLDYDIELKLKSSEVPSLALGDRNRQLGLNTWLRQPKTDYTSRLVAYTHSSAGG